MSRFRLASLGSVAVLALAVAACGGGSVSKADVETTARQTLSDQFKQQAPPITCPKDLEAKVGASIVCAITIDAKIYDVLVKVNSVDGGTAHFNIEVAGTPRP